MGTSQKLSIAHLTEYDRTHGARAWWAECLLCKCTDLNLDPLYPLEDGCGGRGGGVGCGGGQIPGTPGKLVSLK